MTASPRQRTDKQVSLMMGTSVNMINDNSFLIFCLVDFRSAEFAAAEFLVVEGLLADNLAAAFLKAPFAPVLSPPYHTGIQAARIFPGGVHLLQTLPS